MGGLTSKQYFDLLATHDLRGGRPPSYQAELTAGSAAAALTFVYMNRPGFVATCATANLKSNDKHAEIEDHRKIEGSLVRLPSANDSSACWHEAIC
eukprot:scaffold110453_cov21-Prasinocladus_malaysianus.AAC.1